MARDLTTLAAVKTMIGGDAATTTTYDPTLSTLITQASEMLHREANREFIAFGGSNPQTRSFAIDHETLDSRELMVGDMKDTSGLTVSIWRRVDGVKIEDSDTSLIVAEPELREDWQPIAFLKFLPGAATSAQLSTDYRVDVRGNWGFPQVPADVTWLATKQVAKWFERDYARSSWSNQRATDAYDLDIGVRHAVRRYRIPRV